ncbi:hypothetical protein ABID19_006624 [Mesorhizobium robiniae]|uniref:Uncharacterized protein n=1 Tax=Mesorhizobium robiniae TaxID=559315 RepID=A0ABV2GZ43_9HYPH
MPGPVCEETRHRFAVHETGEAAVIETFNASTTAGADLHDAFCVRCIL